MNKTAEKSIWIFIWANRKYGSCLANIISERAREREREKEREGEKDEFIEKRFNKLIFITECFNICSLRSVGRSMYIVF